MNQEHANKLIDYKKIELLTNEQQNPYQNSKICYICKEKFKNKYVKNKKYRKVRDQCHYTGKYRDVVYM